VLQIASFNRNSDEKLMMCIVLNGAKQSVHYRCIKRIALSLER
jgi:hypothetical protein